VLLKRVYIVEDHEDMRIMYKRMFSRSFKDVQVCGETDNGRTALAEIKELNPDLVLIDISLPGMDGLDVARGLRGQRFTNRLLIVTGHLVELYEKESREAGVDGIVSKDELRAIVSEIQRLLNGEGKA
jgi:two-component system, NarL family, response regulator EvgA